ncbi:hypothetical protein A0256_17785 [Mucilaginibacter sp. PAMC 26640]|nr:hypothetical protein A0256_17785 [Mucilaginibacter sp. PAMC 26640]
MLTKNNWYVPANTLIIAGMHRSGTSLISQWLNRCGLNLGDDMLGASSGNLDGHFEDLDFLRFHSDILDANNLANSGFTTKSIELLSPRQKEKLQWIIDFKSQTQGQWGWKDPRTCLFLLHYREFLPGAYYLNIVRDYKSTVSSMIRRDFMEFEAKYLIRPWLSKQVWLKLRRARKMNKFYHERAAFYLQIWLSYNEEILKNIQTLPASHFIVVDHRDLFEYDKKVFNHLIENWKFDLTYCNFSTIFKKNLISKVINVDSYIADKDLITKARRIEKVLRQHI